MLAVAVGAYERFQVRTVGKTLLEHGDDLPRRRDMVLVALAAGIVDPAAASTSCPARSRCPRRCGGQAKGRGTSRSRCSPWRGPSPSAPPESCRGRRNRRCCRPAASWDRPAADGPPPVHQAEAARTCRPSTAGANLAPAHWSAAQAQPRAAGGQGACGNASKTLHQATPVQTYSQSFNHW